MENWSYTMDSESHITIYRNGSIVWEGSYEAFIADGDIRPPQIIADRIHRRAATLSDYESQAGFDAESDAVHN
jgi:hypothetical protein